MKPNREDISKKTGFTPLETITMGIPLRGNGEVPTGFTIVELLTVMSIIIILISLLVPGLNRVRRYALFVKQKAQFDAISKALELFNAENDGYPDSNAYDGTYPSSLILYNGAMKLAEAMVGQDLRGFNPSSVFRRDGLDATGTINLYPRDPGTGSPLYPAYVENIKSRKLNLQLENANAYRLDSIYTTAQIIDSGFAVAGVDANTFVLCDVYTRVTDKKTGRKIGMPILYYKADTTKTRHTDIISDLDFNIYNARDNQNLIDMGLPWLVGPVHPLSRIPGLTTTGEFINDWPRRFYEKIRNDKLPVTEPWPNRADSYILLSAGFDGEYGTADDVFNFSE
jgi:type II secretory pathway pseudopilin PulG